MQLLTSGAAARQCPGLCVHGEGTASAICFRLDRQERIARRVRGRITVPVAAHVTPVESRASYRHDRDDIIRKTTTFESMVQYNFYRKRHLSCMGLVPVMSVPVGG